MLCHRSTVVPGVAVWIALLGLYARAAAAPLDVQLAMAGLPSAQGFAYTTTGSHSGVPEATIFSVGGGVLTQNSIGQSNGVASGGILYTYLGGVTNTESKQIRVRARSLQGETSPNASVGQGGFSFGFTANTTNYGFCVMPTKVGILTSSGFVVFPGTYDNTQFHDYRLEFTPPTTTRIYRDNVLLGSSTAGFPAALTNRFWLGDGTGGANAVGQVESFRFIQDGPTGVASTSWGRVKALYK